MIKTKQTFKSIIDGLGTYLLWYFWTSFLIWLGIFLLNIINIEYLQILGGLLVFRQIRALFLVGSDKHLLKDKDEKERT